MSCDRLLLEGMEFYGYHGDIEAERACGGPEAEIGVTGTLRAGLRGLLLDVEVRGRPRHRPLPECLAAIAGAGLPARVEAWATITLRRLGECEARLHGIPVERV